MTDFVLSAQIKQLAAEAYAWANTEAEDPNKS